jgi:hypothetical protein
MFYSYCIPSMALLPSRNRVYKSIWSYAPVTSSRFWVNHSFISSWKSHVLSHLSIIACTCSFCLECFACLTSPASLTST